MTRRTQRVGEAMREALGELIQRQVKDPRVGFVTITAVRVTPDLGKAHVYYTVLGDDSSIEETQRGLESAAPYLRTETGRRVRLKTLPELHFHYDDTVDQGRRVDEVIAEIHRNEPPPTRVELPPLGGDVEEALDEAAHVLSHAKAVALACHINPDADAIGSILGAALALRDRGVPVMASWDADRVEIPQQYDFLPGSQLLVQIGDLEASDVAVAIDCASSERLGRLLERMSAARVLLNIDHHVSNNGFGAINVVDPTASSSAELVLRLLQRMGAEITRDIATCLYAGLVTDTGRFSYASVTPRTHLAAAVLLERGVAVDAVSQALYERVPFGYLRTLGRVLERSRLLDGPPVVMTHLTQGDLRDGDIVMDDTEDLIDVVRSTRETDVAAIFKEMPDGTWKGSLRSKGATDVGVVAQALGGGGHRLAAGFSLTGTLDEVVERVHGELRARTAQ